MRGLPEWPLFRRPCSGHAAGGSSNRWGSSRFLCLSRGKGGAMDTRHGVFAPASTLCNAGACRARPLLAAQRCCLRDRGTDAQTRPESLNRIRPGSACGRLGHAAAWADRGTHRPPLAATPFEAACDARARVGPCRVALTLARHVFVSTCSLLHPEPRVVATHTFCTPGRLPLAFLHSAVATRAGLACPHPARTGRSIDCWE